MKHEYICLIIIACFRKIDKSYEFIKNHSSAIKFVLPVNNKQELSYFIESRWEILKEAFHEKIFQYITFRKKETESSVKVQNKITSFHFVSTIPRDGNLKLRKESSKDSVHDNYLPEKPNYSRASLKQTKLIGTKTFRLIEKNKNIKRVMRKMKLKITGGNGDMRKHSLLPAFYLTKI
jgi:hypothetical protein